MKKVIWFSLPFLIVATACVYHVRDMIGNDVVILIDGSIIPADRTWKDDDIIFYRNEGEDYILSESQVEFFGQADVQIILGVLQNDLAGLFQQADTTVKQYIPPSYLPSNTGLLFLAIALGLGVLLIVLFIFIRSLAAEKKSPHSMPLITQAPNPKLDESDNSNITKSDIAQYFLNIYRLQTNSPPDAVTSIKKLVKKSTGSNDVYELRIKQGNDWVRRRMSIGPLGEDSGSKSQCYYAIYDKHFVLKIPVKPVNNFEEYIDSIKKEGKIVEKLHPKECIIPKVSVILSQIHHFAEEDGISAEKRERLYVDWLRKNPDFQNYLKIKGSFVFFMDLSKYYFLSHIMDKIHDLKDAIPTEIAENPEIIWDAPTFKGRYGKKNEFVCFEIREVFNKCEPEIRTLMTISDVHTPVTMFQIQKWFLDSLSAKTVTPRESGLPEHFITELNKLLGKAIAKYKEPVEAYLAVVKEYVQTVRFEQNKPQMEGIITNLLELLAWLRTRRIAMRDLKPDNIIVAGDPSKFPLFLMSPAEYSLGIIDVETAVDFEGFKHGNIEQPLLGGTPFFATPSHFFINEVLISSYSKLNKVLHLQDWHAILVMIFKVVTGELLFEKTPKLFGDIKARIREAHLKSDSHAAVLRSASRIFWRNAVEEFQAKCNKHVLALKSIEATIPQNAKRMLKKVLVNEISMTAAKIKHLVESQTIFESSQNRERLINSSPEKIMQFRSELKKKANGSEQRSKEIAETMKMLQYLAELKSFSEQKALSVKILEQSTSRFRAFDLVVIMFKTILETMYKEAWHGQAREVRTTANEKLDDTWLESTVI